MNRVKKMESGCWIWTGSNNGSGYGEIRIKGKKVYAHRYFYEVCVGPIEKGLQIDHLCRNPSCVNPDHLEAVTSKENVRRGLAMGPHPERMKTHCAHGHAFIEENTYVRKDGKGRMCKECVRRAAREYARRKFGYYKRRLDETKTSIQEEPTDSWIETDSETV